MSGEHQTWSVDSTAYLRNLDQEDLRAECISVHYQNAPKKTERGTSIGLRFPTLIVAGYVEKPREVADKIAAILNAHWSEDDTATPPARSYADGVEDAAKVALKHGGMLAMAQGHDDAEGQADRWYEGGKHSAQVIAAAIRLLPLGGKA